MLHQNPRSSNSHLALCQRRSLLQRRAGTLKFVKLLQLEQTADALRRLGLLGQIILLQQLLVLRFEQCIARRRLGEDEKRHPIACVPLICGGKYCEV